MSGGVFLCGTIFSFTGFVFLILVGSLLKLQPLFIHNAKTPHSGANSCFEAVLTFMSATIGFFVYGIDPFLAMLYAVAMGICYTLWRKEKLRSGELDFLSETLTLKQDRTYFGSEDSDEELPLAKNMSPVPCME